MTVYYCDDYVDKTGEYVHMPDSPVRVIVLDISEQADLFKFKTQYLGRYEIDLDLAMPSILEMLNVKGFHQEALNDYISGLVLSALGDGESYYDDLLRLTGRYSADSCQLLDTSAEDTILIDMLSDALAGVCNCIFNQIESIAYRGKFLAYGLYSYSCGVITLVSNDVPVMSRNSTTQIVELSTRTIVDRYASEV